MKGELVILRAFGGEPLVRRIWDYDLNAVYVTKISVESEENVVVSIGFPHYDVFKYEAKQ